MEWECKRKEGANTWEGKGNRSSEREIQKENYQRDGRICVGFSSVGNCKGNVAGPDDERRQIEMYCKRDDDSGGDDDGDACAARSEREKWTEGKKEERNCP